MFYFVYVWPYSTVVYQVHCLVKNNVEFEFAILQFEFEFRISNRESVMACREVTYCRTMVQYYTLYCRNVIDTWPLMYYTDYLFVRATILAEAIIYKEPNIDNAIYWQACEQTRTVPKPINKPELFLDHRVKKPNRPEMIHWLGRLWTNPNDCEAYEQALTIPRPHNRELTNQKVGNGGYLVGRTPEVFCSKRRKIQLSNEVLYSGAVAATRSGNERSVRHANASWTIKRGRSVPAIRFWSAC